MCGQVGIIFGKKRRRPLEIEYLLTLFTQMLVHSEVRGPHASGIAWLKTDGRHQIFKQPLRANAFVTEPAFQEAMDQVDHDTTILMGHTRWRTRGNPLNNRNNHPIRASHVIGTHNGTIYNADQLFKRLRLRRFAEVDSELIFRLAQRAAKNGAIDPDRLVDALTPCQGQISAVLASRRDPETTIILKGNKPLHLFTHPEFQVLAYASKPHFMEVALSAVTGWLEVEVPPMTMLVCQHQDVLRIDARPFHFLTQIRPGTLPEGVRA